MWIHGRLVPSAQDIEDTFHGKPLCIMVDGSVSRKEPLIATVLLPLLYRREKRLCAPILFAGF